MIRLPLFLLLLSLGSVPQIRAQDSLAQEKSVALRVRAAKIDPAVKTAFKVTLQISEGGAPVPTRAVDGREVAVLRNGKTMTVSITSEKAGFVRVFYHNAKGELIQLLPNQFAKEGFIKAATPLVIGGPEDTFELVVEPPLGSECLSAIVSTRPFTDETQVAVLLKTHAFVPVATSEVADAGVAVSKSVALVPKEALVGAALLHTLTE